jgi:hypothetical protein
VIFRKAEMIVRRSSDSIHLTKKFMIDGHEIRYVVGDLCSIEHRHGYLFCIHYPLATQPDDFALPISTEIVERLMEFKSRYPSDKHMICGLEYLPEVVRHSLMFI